MTERVDRKTDERLYQPRIHSKLIRAIHRVKVETGLPMTVLVQLALTEYLARRQEENGSRTDKSTN